MIRRYDWYGLKIHPLSTRVSYVDAVMHTGVSEFFRYNSLGVLQFIMSVIIPLSCCWYGGAYTVVASAYTAPIDAEPPAKAITVTKIAIL